MSKKRENKEKRLEYIRNLMKTTGSTRVNASEIARLFEVSETVIRGDLKEIYKEMNEKSKEAVGVELTKIDAGLRRGMRELEKIVESDRKPEDKLKAIEIYSKMASDYVSSKSRLGLLKADGKETSLPPIVCFTMQSCDMNAFVDYCVKEGHPEVKELQKAFETLTAEEEVKERLKRDERLKDRDVVTVRDTADMKEAADKHGLSVDAIREAMKEDVEEEYFCEACQKMHPKNSFCLRENELRNKRRSED